MVTSGPLFSPCLRGRTDDSVAFFSFSRASRRMVAVLLLFSSFSSGLACGFNRPFYSFFLLIKFAAWVEEWIGTRLMYGCLFSLPLPLFPLVLAVPQSWLRPFFLSLRSCGADQGTPLKSLEPPVSFFFLPTPAQELLFSPPPPSHVGTKSPRD